MIVFPVFGMIRHVVSALSRKPIFRFIGMVYVMVPIGAIRFIA